MTTRLEVTATQVAAAKLLVKRARARGLPVDPAVQAIADTRPAADRQSRFAARAGEGGRD